MGEILLLSIKFYAIYSAFALLGAAILGSAFKLRNIEIQLTKILGLLGFGWIVWMLASLKIIHYNNPDTLNFLFLGTLITSAGILVLRRRKSLQDAVQNFAIQDLLKLAKSKRLSSIIIAELFIFAVFVIAATVRGFNANLEGTERFMDIHYLMSSAKADFFPYTDLWSALQPVNYYYYGFYLLSVIIRLAGISIPVGYNLAFVFTFVLGGVFSYYIAGRFVKSVFFSLLAAFFAITSGNFHYFSCVATSASPGDNILASLSSACFYPVSTRIFDESRTINEFPSYSYLLGDLHPHVISIPFFLAAVYILIKLSQAEKFKPGLAIALVFLFANVALINSWDFVSLGLILLLVFAVVLFKQYRLHSREVKQNYVLMKLSLRDFLNYSNKFYTILLIGICSIVAPFILFWPFYKSYKAPVGGLGQDTFYAWSMFIADNPSTQKSDFPAFVYSLHTGASWNEQLQNSNFTLFTADQKYINDLCADKSRESLMSWRCKLREFTKKFQYPSSGNFLFGFWGSWFFVSIVAIVLLLRKRVNIDSKTEFFVLTAVTVLLIFITEFFFVKELFHIANPPYFRANTVFKFGYHAWMLSGILLAVGLSAIFNYFKQVKSKVLMAIYLLIFAAILIIKGTLTVLGTYSVYLPSGASLSDVNLDGSAFIESHSLADRMIVDYINEHERDRLIILEAAGDSYSYHARIGAFTGMSNIVNWPTHEYTWRFGQDVQGPSDHGYAVINQRMTDVKTIYTTADEQVRKDLLDKYHVKYIVISELEKKDYTDIKIDALKELGTIVIEREGNYLIKL